MVRAPSDLYSKIYAVVAKIPRGRVASYGEVALRAGLPRHARMVGYALHALRSGTSLPWHRVINAQGGISLGRIPGEEGLQRALLEAEGVEFDPSGRVDMGRFGWGRRGAKRPAPRPKPGCSSTHPEEAPPRVP